MSRQRHTINVCGYDVPMYDVPMIEAKRGNHRFVPSTKMPHIRTKTFGLVETKPATVETAVCAACDELIDMSVCPHCRMPIVPQE